MTWTQWSSPSKLGGQTLRSCSTSHCRSASAGTSMKNRRKMHTKKFNNINRCVRKTTKHYYANNQTSIGLGEERFEDTWLFRLGEFRRILRTKGLIARHKGRRSSLHDLLERFEKTLIQREHWVANWETLSTLSQCLIWIQATMSLAPYARRILGFNRS